MNPVTLHHLPSPTDDAITLLTALDAELNAAHTQQRPVKHRDFTVTSPTGP